MMTDRLLPQYTDRRACPWCGTLCERNGRYRYDPTIDEETWAPEPLIGEEVDSDGEGVITRTATTEKFDRGRTKKRSSRHYFRVYTHTCGDPSGACGVVLPVHMTTQYEGEIPPWAVYKPPPEGRTVGDMVRLMVEDIAARSGGGELW